MDADFDADLAQMLEEALEGALAQLSPDQRAKVDADPELHARLSAAAMDAVDGVAAGIVERLRRDAPAMVRHRRRGQQAMEKQIDEHWGRAFDASEAVMKVAFEVGEFHYKKHVPPDGERSYAFEVLARLQARGLRIAEEVLVLLKAGYGQAAMARWRSLHEVAVVADFILEHGDECAERYFDHEAVETYRAMAEFQQHAGTLGEQKYSDEAMAVARAGRDAVVAKHGARFGGQYGWAQEYVAAKDSAWARQNVTFKAIEESVEADRFRPRYRVASHAVHANPMGVTRMPDSLPSERGLVLLTGPSAAGLADPGYGALVSLTSVTEAVLAWRPGEASHLLARSLQLLTEDAETAYREAHDALEADDSRPTRSRRRSRHRMLDVAVDGGRAVLRRLGLR